jgi:maleate isomerase
VLAGIGAGVLAEAAGCASPNAMQSKGPVWRPDGKGSLARFGILTPHFDPVPETEITAMAPPGVSIHAARVQWSGGARAFAEPPYVDEAVAELAGAGPRNLNPGAILFAFTSSSYALGAAAEDAVRARLEQKANGIPVIFASQAAKAALNLLGAKRICLIHPPWWSESSNEQGARYFRAQGFEVVECVRMTPERSFAEVDPQEVFAFVVEHAPESAEAVFIGGNGMRSAGAIEALEERLKRPVIAANQVLLWDALRRIGSAGLVRGYGSIFQR